MKRLYRMTTASCVWLSTQYSKLFAFIALDEKFFWKKMLWVNEERMFLNTRSKFSVTAIWNLHETEDK